MENISLQPSKKYITKGIMVIATVSALVILIGLVLQIAIPLGGKATAGEVAAIVWSLVLVILMFKWFFALTITIIWIKNLFYVIQSDRITIYKGIITKIEQNIPYKAITDFMLHRSLYDRILGIGSIKIQTAGQSHATTGYEGIISGLLNYHEVMEELRTRLKRYNEITEPSEMNNVEENFSQEMLNELKRIRELLEMK